MYNPLYNPYNQHNQQQQFMDVGRQNYISNLKQQAAQLTYQYFHAILVNVNNTPLLHLYQQWQSLKQQFAALGITDPGLYGNKSRLYEAYITFEEPHNLEWHRILGEYQARIMQVPQQVQQVQQQVQQPVQQQVMVVHQPVMVDRSPILLDLLNHFFRQHFVENTDGNGNRGTTPKDIKYNGHMFIDNYNIFLSTLYQKGFTIEDLANLAAQHPAARSWLQVIAQHSRHIFNSTGMLIEENGILHQVQQPAPPPPPAAAPPPPPPPAAALPPPPTPPQPPAAAAAAAAAAAPPVPIIADVINQPKWERVPFYPVSSSTSGSSATFMKYVGKHIVTKDRQLPRTISFAYKNDPLLATLNYLPIDGTSSHVRTITKGDSSFTDVSHIMAVSLLEAAKASKLTPAECTAIIEEKYNNGPISSNTEFESKKALFLALLNERNVEYGLFECEPNDASKKGLEIKNLTPLAIQLALQELELQAHKNHSSVQEMGFERRVAKMRTREIILKDKYGENLTMHVVKTDFRNPSNYGGGIFGQYTAHPGDTSKHFTRHPGSFLSSEKKTPSQMEEELRTGIVEAAISSGMSVKQLKEHLTHMAFVEGGGIERDSQIKGWQIGRWFRKRRMHMPLTSSFDSYLATTMKEKGYYCVPTETKLDVHGDKIVNKKLNKPVVAFAALGNVIGLMALVAYPQVFYHKLKESLVPLKPKYMPANVIENAIAKLEENEVKQAAGNKKKAKEVKKPNTDETAYYRQDIGTDIAHDVERLVSNILHALKTVSPNHEDNYLRLKNKLDFCNNVLRDAQFQNIFKDKSFDDVFTRNDAGGYELAGTTDERVKAYVARNQKYRQWLLNKNDHLPAGAEFFKTLEELNKKTGFYKDSDGTKGMTFNQMPQEVIKLVQEHLQIQVNLQSSHQAPTPISKGNKRGVSDSLKPAPNSSCSFLSCCSPFIKISSRAAD